MICLTTIEIARKTWIFIITNEISQLREHENFSNDQLDGKYEIPLDAILFDLVENFWKIFFFRQVFPL